MTRNIVKRVSPILQEAHRLALASLEDIKDESLKYCTRYDLRVLGTALAICRTRGEGKKVKMLEQKIEQMRKEVHRA